MGVWIETGYIRYKSETPVVTPYVGVWIETRMTVDELYAVKVTPYVGVWIETDYSRLTSQNLVSLLMWECGLKHPPNQR